MASDRSPSATNSPIHQPTSYIDASAELPAAPCAFYIKDAPPAPNPTPLAAPEPNPLKRVASSTSLDTSRGRPRTRLDPTAVPNSSSQVERHGRRRTGDRTEYRGDGRSHSLAEVNQAQEGRFHHREKKEGCGETMDLVSPPETPVMHQRRRSHASGHGEVSRHVGSHSKSVEVAGHGAEVTRDQTNHMTQAHGRRFWSEMMEYEASVRFRDQQESKREEANARKEMQLEARELAVAEHEKTTDVLVKDAQNQPPSNAGAGAVHSGGEEKMSRVGGGATFPCPSCEETKAGTKYQEIALQRMQDVLNKKLEEMQQLKQKYKDLNETCENRKQTQNAFAARGNAALAKNQALEKELAETKKELATLKKQIAKEKERKIEIQEALEKEKKGHKDCRKELGITKRNLTVTRNKVESKGKSQDDLLNERNEAIAKQTDLAKRLEMSDNLRRDRDQKLNGKDRIIAELKRVGLVKDGTIADKEAEIKDREAVIDDLHATINEKDVEIKDREADIEDIQATLKEKKSDVQARMHEHRYANTCKSIISICAFTLDQVRQYRESVQKEDIEHVLRFAKTLTVGLGDEWNTVLWKGRRKIQQVYEEFPDRSGWIEVTLDNEYYPQELPDCWQKPPPASRAISIATSTTIDNPESWADAVDIADGSTRVSQEVALRQSQEWAEKQVQMASYSVETGEAVIGHADEDHSSNRELQAVVSDGNGDQVTVASVNTPEQLNLRPGNGEEGHAIPGPAGAVELWDTPSQVAGAVSSFAAVEHQPLDNQASLSHSMTESIHREANLSGIMIEPSHGESDSIRNIKDFFPVATAVANEIEMKIEFGGTMGQTDAPPGPQSCGYAEER